MSTSYDFSVMQNGSLKLSVNPMKAKTVALFNAAHSLSIQLCNATVTMHPNGGHPVFTAQLLLDGERFEIQEELDYCCQPQVWAGRRNISGCAVYDYLYQLAEKYGVVCNDKFLANSQHPQSRWMFIEKAELGKIYDELIYNPLKWGFPEVGTEEKAFLKYQRFFKACNLKLEVKSTDFKTQTLVELNHVKDKLYGNRRFKRIDNPYQLKRMVLDGTLMRYNALHQLEYACERKDLEILLQSLHSLNTVGDSLHITSKEDETQVQAVAREINRVFRRAKIKISLDDLVEYFVARSDGVFFTPDMMDQLQYMNVLEWWMPKSYEKVLEQFMDGLTRNESGAVNFDA